MNNGHKGPIIVALVICIQWTFLSEVTYDFVWTHEVHTNIASPAMLNIHSNSDMLEAPKIGFFQHVLGNFKGNRKSINALGNGLVDMNPRRIVPGLGFDWFECLGSLDNGPTIDLSISKSVTKFLSNGSGLPVILLLRKIDRHCGLHNQILHVPPCKLGINLQYQSKDTGCKRSSSRSTTVTCIARIGTYISRVLYLLSAEFKSKLLAAHTIKSPLPLLYVTTSCAEHLSE